MTFRILSNKSDPEADLPPHWNPQFALRPEQRRGLTWMLAQEAESKPFVEAEVEEARLPQQRIRAEGRAAFENYARGGIVADQVRERRRGGKPLDRRRPSRRISRTATPN